MGLSRKTAPLTAIAQTPTIQVDILPGAFRKSNGKRWPVRNETAPGKSGLEDQADIARQAADQAGQDQPSSRIAPPVSATAMNRSDRKGSSAGAPLDSSNRRSLSKGTAAVRINLRHRASDRKRSFRFR